MRKERKGKGESAAKGKRPPCGLPAPKGPTWAAGISKDKGCAQKRAEPRWLRGRSSRPGTRPGVPGFRLWTLGIQTSRAGFWGAAPPEGQAARSGRRTRKTLKPLWLKGFLLVEHRRFELLTPTLPVLCATNCANAPRFSESYHSIFPISCKALFAFFCDVFLTFSDGSAVLSPCMFSQHQVV